MSTDKKQRIEKTLERYGVWVKAGPWEVDDGADFELINIDDSDNGELQITEEEERLLGKLETGPYANESADTSKGGGVDLKAPNKLNRIEEKLDALKDEIRYLKDEISELRLPSETRSPEKSGGYFDDEDDETIALTDDELVNILDSADMSDETADKDAIEKTQTVESDATLPKSDSATELDSPAAEASEIEQETAERPDSDYEPIVSLDEIEDMSDEDEDFEEFDEITDIEPSETDIAEDEAIEDSNEPRSEEMEIEDSRDSSGIRVESEAFDEGEEVEIMLDEEGDSEKEREDHDTDTDMEEVSLGEFGFETQMDEGTDAVSDLTDKTQDIENLEEFSDEMDTAPSTESDGSEQSDSGENAAKPIELSDIGVGDMMSAEPDIESADRIELDEEEKSEDIGLPPESLDEVEDLDIAPLDEEVPDESSAEKTPESLGEMEDLDITPLDEEVPDESPAEKTPEFLDEVEDLDIAPLDEEVPDESSAEKTPESLGEVDDLDITPLDEEVPDESPAEKTPEFLDEVDDLDITPLDEEVPDESSAEKTPESLGEIEDLGIAPLDEEVPDESPAEKTPESLDEVDDLDITPLDEEVPDESPAEKTPESPGDAYNELPGTEEVDLDSLEALTSDTKSEKPETDEAGKAESLSIPGKLQDEIKDVLKYMDELLDWLPHKKVQEFERSEHFEVYRRIFEELGISK